MLPSVIPLAAFAGVVLIVAITRLTRIHTLELEVRQNLHAKEIEHQRKMRELNLELECVKQAE